MRGLSDLFQVAADFKSGKSSSLDLGKGEFFCSFGLGIDRKERLVDIPLMGTEYAIHA
jgi:hypothetical protein